MENINTPRRLNALLVLAPADYERIDLSRGRVDVVRNDTRDDGAALAMKGLSSHAVFDVSKVADERIHLCLDDDVDAGLGWTRDNGGTVSSPVIDAASPDGTPASIGPARSGVRAPPAFDAPAVERLLVTQAILRKPGNQSFGAPPLLLCTCT